MENNIGIAITDHNDGPTIKVTKEAIEVNDLILTSKQSLGKYYIPIEWIENYIDFQDSEEVRVLTVMLHTWKLCQEEDK